MTFGDRIRQAREKQGLSQEELARLVGISRNAISLWESNKTRPATGNLLRLPEMLAVDPLWLFADEGNTDLQEIPLVSWISAGKLADALTVEHWDDVKNILTAGLPPGKWIALTVDGTSMNRIAPPGALIFVDCSDRVLVSGKDYVFATAEGATFKRYRQSPPRLEPYSTNTEHESIFPEGQVKVVGRVRRVQIDS